MSILVGATSACAGAAGQSGAGFTIDQSLRFRGSEELKRSSVRSASNAAATISVWVKLGNVDSSMRRILTIESSGSSWALGLLYNSNKFWVYDSSTTDGNASVTDGVHRDPSAWYHIVYNRSAGGTDQELYINGVLQDGSASFATSVDLFSIRHEIGGRDGDPTTSWEGYMAEFHVVDGQKLDPTSFGETNDDGVWVPINYSGGHGSMGYYLPFDSSAGIGDDASTNASDFTATGFQTTSTHENYDLDYNDTPTSNYSTLNALRNTATTGRGTQDANLTLDGVDETWAATPGTCAQNSGKRFFEMEVSSSGSGANNNFIGFASADCRFNINALQDDSTEGAKGRMLLCDDGKTKLDNAARATYTSNIAASNVIGCLIDFDGEEVEFFRNGTSLGAIDISSSPLVDGRMVLPVNIVIGSPHNTHDQYINYGQRDFQHAPSGVTAADNGFETNNLPEPTIKNGKEHFDIRTYQSAATAADVTINNLEFQPDFIWIKSTSTASGHELYDSVRGVNIGLGSNDSSPEGTVSDSMKSFDSNGFTLGTGQSNINFNSRTYVAWCWKAGGTAVSNSDGTITSNVSANTDAGFSIVSYTGNSTLGATIGHGLNSAPEWILVKNRDSSADWAVYHEYADATAPEDKVLALNATDAATDAVDRWNDTAPTSSVFSVGDAIQTNGSNNMIAYCWHSVEGFSKFGSYTGGGSGSAPDYDGSYIYLGFRPAWLLIKRSNAGGDPWILLDSTRDTHNFAFQALQPNNSNAEVSSGDQFAIDFLSNGFKCRSSNAAINNSSATYVYMAFAESPFGGENAPPATAR